MMHDAACELVTKPVGYPADGTCLCGRRAMLKCKRMSEEDRMKDVPLSSHPDEEDWVARTYQGGGL